MLIDPSDGVLWLFAPLSTPSGIVGSIPGVICGPLLPSSAVAPPSLARSCPRWRRRRLRLLIDLDLGVLREGEVAPAGGALCLALGVSSRGTVSHGIQGCRGPRGVHLGSHMSAGLPSSVACPPNLGLDAPPPGDSRGRLHTWRGSTGGWLLRLQ